MIKQHTPEWYEAKKSKIGASEIFTLVAHYCKEELRQANIDLGNEKAFKTPLELYLKVKFAIQDDSFSEVNREFGLGMESYILYRISQEEKFKDNLKFTSCKDFVVNETWGKFAACSPDGYIQFDPEGKFNQIEDYDKKGIINHNWEEGVLEFKTTPYGFAFEADKGLKWAYLFQLHYQMLVCNKKWGILAAIAPKEKRYDTDFFKGKVLGYLRGVDDLEGNISNTDSPFKYLEQFEYYNLYHYIYPENKTIQSLCILALERFKKALDDNILPNLSIDCLVRLQREKSLLAKMYPDKYGSIKATEELDGLLKDEREANIQALKDTTERQNYICEIIKKMGSHQELVGSESIAKFAKGGSLRFSKTKEGK